MKEHVIYEKNPGPMLFPYAPEKFWPQVRQIIREEIKHAEKQTMDASLYQTTGLTYRPLDKMAEVCKLFHVSKPTIYEWVEHGKLKPFKIRSRVYFLWQDIQHLRTPS